jgi:hypothetical protein
MDSLLDISKWVTYFFSSSCLWARFFPQGALLGGAMGRNYQSK